MDIPIYCIQIKYMKKKVTHKQAIKLFKIELGLVVPPRKGKKPTVSDEIHAVLLKTPVGGSFLIKRNQEALVRRLLKDNAADFKSFKITIRQAEEGRDYMRVYRLPVDGKKDKK